MTVLQWEEYSIPHAALARRIRTPQGTYKARKSPIDGQWEFATPACKGFGFHPQHQDHFDRDVFAFLGWPEVRGIVERIIRREIDNPTILREIAQ